MTNEEARSLGIAESDPDEVPEVIEQTTYFNESGYCGCGNPSPNARYCDDCLHGE